jgi:hypothetical protein
MEQTHKFRRLPVQSRHLRLKSLLLLGLVRLGLWLLPFRTLRRILARLRPAHAAAHEGHQASIRHIVWAVTVASRYVPAATCLTQALTTQVLLRRYGYAADLRIGVARSEAGEFQAHAWVECQGEVVIGGVQAPSRYTPLPTLDGERP